MRWMICWLWMMTVCCGCTTQEQSFWEKAGILGELGQPRLHEVLDHLQRTGIEKADEATVFEFSFWGMYGDVTWEDESRKPRFEGATIRYRQVPVIVAVSVVRPGDWPEPDELKVIRTHGKKSAEPNGATILVKGKRWSVGFTMQQSDEQLANELTDRLAAFVQDYLHPRV